MMEKKMKLSKNFWKAHRGELMVSSDGKLAFTEAGRKKYAPLFAKHGIVFSSVRTLDAFRDVMKVVTARELEANADVLKGLLKSPETTEHEREVIRQVLGLSGGRGQETQNV